MGGTMFYTEEQICAARNISIIKILDDMSEKYKRCGKEFYWLAHDSVKFHDNEAGAGLNPTLNEHIITQNNMQKNIRGDTSQSLIPVIPDMVNEPINAIEYLTKERGIDETIVSFFVGEQLIMETAQHHNVRIMNRMIHLLILEHIEKRL